ncbi:autophagy-related protein [Parastagonospora nodorum]|nr:autophagy-related protein [Parastagonospora nodorum]KAH4416069.1 autophagy-related protein [Parastagonospora nodorum]KAH4443897.1 autophagy-related protein [Parastagonospora nodorum]KAH4456567.1 autophagy-related protein [Parastagonospora nodorum]KAH4493662.1 autophagy-related protein [Parastagonospora nodorum]
MAFFSGLSSSIGKKLLLYGLRQIDILDKDPADFVSVDVGKKTTLEVRDVGLHVKKLVALLHLTLPPEIHLSKARASLLRVTFVLDFGVPQISIEVHGIQVQAGLVEEERETLSSKSKAQASGSKRLSSPPPFRDDVSDTSSDGDDHVPTVDELAKSFLRAEPTAEIRELEQQLESRPEYMQESMASNDDESDDGSAGMGAPLALPSYLRNILNTALDRLSIVVNDIDVEMEDQFSADASDVSSSAQSSPASLNFHIERVAIDSVTSQNPHVEVGSTESPLASDANLGKRRMRIESICARLVSDAEDFESMSKMSQTPSPVLARSELSTGHKAPSEPSSDDHVLEAALEADAVPDSQHNGESTSPHDSYVPSIQASVASFREQRSASAVPSSPEQPQLTSSVHTVDDDRFADAFSDDGLHEALYEYSPSHSRQSLPIRDLGGSSILYDDDGMLDYALQHDMLNSRFEDVFDEQSPADETGRSEVLQASIPASETSIAGLPTVSALGQSFRPPSELSKSELPTVSALGRSFRHPNDLSTSDLPSVSALGRSLRPPSPVDSQPASQSSSRTSEHLQPLTDNLAAAQEHMALEPEIRSHGTDSSPLSSQSPIQDLAESQLFSHDEAESMYMSALSAAQADTAQAGHIPGGWDSSSGSSQSTGSVASGSVPEDMIAGSILAPFPEPEEGCETPRPATPLGQAHPVQVDRAQTPTMHGGIHKQAKLFLTVDLVTVWFPLGLDSQESDVASESVMEDSSMDFKSPSLGEDSIFAEMPGSFSNYAQSSSHRRKPSLEASSRRRVTTKGEQTERTANKPTSPSSVSVEVGIVAGHMDLSTGRIMYRMFSRVLAALTGETPMNTKPEIPDEITKDSTNGLNVVVQRIGISWLENILSESAMAGDAASRVLAHAPLDAIIRTSCENVRIITQNRSKESRTRLQVGQFVLASLDHDILAFQSSKARSRRSVSNVSEQLSNDIEIDYEQGKDKRITVVTRPVRVLLDLQKIDDALSSFGGFSGVLELSSSISSANATVDSPVMSPTQPRARGVHFGDSPPSAPQEAVAPSKAPKTQIQLGEVAFTLQGRTCAVKLQTTSVRIAMREGNVRLKVSEIHLSGPYLNLAQTGAPLLVDVRGTTVNFLFAPEEADLARLISMITPSKDPYENNDDILIDTLLRQRRKGSVLRIEVSGVGVRVSDLEQMKSFEALGLEVARLSKVTKYLPDDDRPGLLSLVTVQQVDAAIAINEQLGDVSISLTSSSVAHVGVPALLAAEVGKAKICRGEETLLHEVVKSQQQEHLPAIMIRMVGDEMEPMIKAKLFNVCAEYRVSTLMAALGISEDGTVDDIALGIAASVATITGTSSPKTLSRQSTQASPPTIPAAKPLQVDLLMRNCAVGLNPRKIASKALFVLTDAHIAGKQAKDNYCVTFELRKASIHAIDDVARLEEDYVPPSPAVAALMNRHLHELRELGYVSLSSISAAKVLVNIAGDGKDQPQLVDVEFKNELFVLESCADSTQTLAAILNGLQPPTPPSTAEQYRTVVPLQEMMESFTGGAISAQTEIEDDDFMSNADLVDDEVPTNLEFVGSMYNSQSLPTDEEMGDSLLGEDDLGALATPPITRQRGDRALLESFQEKYEVTETESDFDFNDNYFQQSEEDGKGKARKWDSAKNQYHLSNEFKQPEAPLKVRVRDVNIIWNLYDGYDWPRTRGIITQAVDDVEARAEERRQKALEDEEDDDFVEEDFLFNSVWIGVPVKDEKGALARRINHDIDDLASETGSYATSTNTRSTGATARPRSTTKPKRRLKLERSKHKKVAFSLMGVAVDLIVFPPDSGETVNSIDVRVRDLEIFDHVPSSTWRKFLTCLIDPSAREMNKPMINLDLVTVKPVTELAASELVIKVTVLPLRLHVDQDALDFITRFFEFKDDSAPSAAPAGDQPFIQRLEVKAVTLKLDYKPKRVDYRGIRSGHTTEFMNFLILDGSDITLRHAIVYGITSFDKLHNTLNDVWMPDVKRNQLPGVLSGLAAVRPLVNVGSGMRDLVVVPMREYRKDGRIVRSLQKGVYAFAKNTTSEVARLGAKVAIGTQNLLEGAEAFLAPQEPASWDGEDPDSSSDEPRAVSHYANQPIGVRAGLRSAAKHLERDLLTARDAVIAIPSEIMEEGSGVGMARALARHAPTVILRPAVGATKAVSNALLGVGNALDQGSRRKIEDKYKSS